jgi:heat shock protein HslJ
MEDDELVLEDDDGQELLRLGEASLIGDWEATSFRQRDAVASLLPGTEITARFRSDRTLTGSAGCNDYSAGYTTHGSSVDIEPAAVTRKACTSPEGVMEQENDYVAALTQAASHTVEGQMLTLLAADGTIVATYLARSDR